MLNLRRKRHPKARGLDLRRVAASAALALCCGCSSGEGTPAHQDSPSECSPGLERCECLPSGGCDRDLECRSGLCVATQATTEANDMTVGDLSTMDETTTQAQSSSVGPVLDSTNANASAESVPSSNTADSTESATSTMNAPATADSSAQAEATSAAPSSNNDSLSVEAPPDPFGNNDPGCGDGVLAEMEVCDDGNEEDNDGCRSDCSGVEPGFSCPTGGGQCLLFAVCGDGWLSPTEPCDDGNLTDEDGCSSRCIIEAGKSCVGEPSVCETNQCGDGIKAGIESCDDGNVMNGDGCDERCQVEPCDATVVAMCESVCGDGLVEGEMCDDGNRIDGDGCTSSCQVELGFTCANDPDAASECLALCGDAVVVFGEQCDDGFNDLGYGECGPGCLVAEYCGDGILQPDHESCDVGRHPDDTCVNCGIVN